VILTFEYKCPVCCLITRDSVYSVNAHNSLLLLSLVNTRTQRCNKCYNVVSSTTERAILEGYDPKQFTEILSQIKEVRTMAKVVAKKATKKVVKAAKKPVAKKATKKVAVKKSR